MLQGIRPAFSLPGFGGPFRQYGGCYSHSDTFRLVREEIEIHMGQPFFHRMLRPFAQVRENEVVTALLMFSYSFLSMTAYNILKPITRSMFIADT